MNRPSIWNEQIFPTEARTALRHGIQSAVIAFIVLTAWNFL